MRTPARSILGALSVAVCVLGLAQDGDAQSQLDATHRAALERFLQASRTRAVISHSGVPAMIAAAAMNEWGFGLADLRVAEIVPDVDGRALDDRIVEIHGRHLTAEQAAGAAAFYESAPSTRMLAHLLRGSLPASDPLARGDVGPPSESDRQAFQQFSESALGAHIRAVTPLITEGVLQAVDEAAGRAIERYVTRNGLPHRRLQRAPTGTVP